MRMGNRNSINFRIKSTFIIIIIIMSISFIYSNMSKNRIIEEHNEAMRINTLLNELSIDLNQSWTHFESYIRSKNVETYENYGDVNNNIQKIFKDVTPKVKMDKDSGIYLRNLDNMYEWFKREMDFAIVREDSNIESYEQYMKIRTMNHYISQHSSNLTSSYLQFTNSNYSEILDTYTMLETNLYFIQIITIIISIIILKVVNDDILSTLENLSVSVKELSDANWDTPDIESDSYLELYELTNTFNHMKNSINLYIEKLNEAAEMEREYQKEKIKNIEKDKIIRETKLKALQMQINPHFLFNNLNTVSRMAMFEDADKTVELVEALSKILRFNLSQENNFIKLKDELQIVKAYFLIQRVKYEDRVGIEYNIDKKLYDIHIPPMIIQLLVENAMKHGFNVIERRGTIKINIERDKDFLVILVEDDGIGIPQKKLERIINRDISSERESKVDSTGLGINNIILRLKIYFNRDDLLSISSKENIGTQVKVLIPIEESELIAKNIDS